MKPELEAICTKWENENLPRNGAIRGAVDEAYQHTNTLAVEKGDYAYKVGVGKGRKQVIEIINNLFGSQLTGYTWDCLLKELGDKP